MSLPHSGGKTRHNSRAAGDAQLHSTKAFGPYHLPHRGGSEQCERERGRATDAVHSYKNHIGPPEKR